MLGSVTSVYSRTRPTERARKWQSHNGDGFTVRTTRTDPRLCDGEEGVSGYVDWGNEVFSPSPSSVISFLSADDNHLYFWAFESRNDVARDPVILWLQGGPGGSSVFGGGLMELGACLFDRTVPISHIDTFNSTTYNPYAWNSNATVIFVDQPLDVGYSYGKRKVSHLADAMDDLYAFLVRLFAARPDWGAQDFYIAGESYGGSWVPALGATIHRMQSSRVAKLAAATSSRQLSAINLKGIMVGNGLMDQKTQRRGNWETGCTSSGSGRRQPIFNASQCTRIAETTPRCEELTQACEGSDYDMDICNVVEAYCMKNGFDLLNDTPWNGYDLSINCTATPQLCELPLLSMMAWVNSEEVRDHLGVSPEKGTALMVSPQVSQDFYRNAEVGYPSYQWVTELLDNGIRVLIYAGNRDWMCTAPGMKLFVDNLVWRGSGPFRSQPNLPLSHEVLGLPLDESENRSALGYYKSYSLLSFVEVEAAGHMVPMDKPQVAHAMMKKWLQGEL
ncbi:Alpha/Beta hydrolase protein [Dactylonectria estremocensis]|uniref:Carboxypeptidase n=1 Tax=Dactylonectria estremocensis TaxID=1079267 RepID=A0A9P9J2U7_9HYPO|nr:Alpha/Beta hydrolase protein [Dactylonectria estremocensis]